MKKLHFLFMLFLFFLYRSSATAENQHNIFTPLNPGVNNPIENNDRTIQAEEQDTLIEVNAINKKKTRSSWKTVSMGIKKHHFEKNFIKYIRICFGIGCPFFCSAFCTGALIQLIKFFRLFLDGKEKYTEPVGIMIGGTMGGLIGAYVNKLFQKNFSSKDYQEKKIITYGAPSIIPMIGMVLLATALKK